MAYRRTPAVQERLDAQRARLLDAATTAVATHGYAGCSIAAVAKNAGVATGTLYRHFDGKGELFAEVFQSVCSREVSAARDAERAMRAPVLAYALLVEPVDPLVDEQRLMFRESFRDCLATAIRSAVDTGEIPSQDATLTAACIVGAIGEALILPLRGGTTDPAAIDAILAFTLRSLGSFDDTHA